MTAVQPELRSSFGSAVARWWRNWVGNRADLFNLNRLDPYTIKEIASEVGVNPSDIRTLAGKWPDSADLLSRRMASLHLDPQHLKRTEPAVTNDLKRLCSLCAAKRRCEHDLDTRAADPVWRQYCPNTTTLTALIAEPKAPKSRQRE